MDKQDIRDRLGNVDQIRDIIIGRQLREYDERLGQFESQLSLIDRDLHDRVEELKVSLSTQLSTAVDGFEKRLKGLAAALEDETIELRQQGDRLTQKLQSSSQNLDGEIDRKTGSLNERLSETRDKLQDDIRSLKAQVFEQLEERFSALRDGKLAKDEVADLLFELGIRLRGEEVVGALRAATDDSGTVTGEFVQHQ
ncbi:MAG: hypothetical protein Fur0042_23430 [Cyanophyceae cyanobacterium]